MQVEDFVLWEGADGEQELGCDSYEGLFHLLHDCKAHGICVIFTVAPVER